MKKSRLTDNESGGGATRQSLQRIARGLENSEVKQLLGCRLR